MLLPHNICLNTIKVYTPLQKIYDKIHRELKSEDLVEWNKENPKTLIEHCLETIAKFFEESNFPIELPLCSDTCLLLDILPLTLSLKLSVTKINDDIYWKRSYKNRWPELPPRGKSFTDVPVYKQKWLRTSNTTSRSSVYLNEDLSDNSQVTNEENKDNNGNDIEKELKSKNVDAENKDEDEDIIKTKNNDETTKKLTEIIAKSSIGTENSQTLKDRSWKQCYLEKHLEESLESLEPENYDPQKIKDLSDLCENYVRRLILQELKAPIASDIPSDYIPLHPILSGLPKLKELSVCYKQTYVGEHFSWHALKTTMNDIKSLSAHLENTNLTILRVINSDVDCKKVTVWVKALLKNETLKVLDFSHCKIADEGVLAIGKLILIHPTLSKIILKNNNIGPKGAEVLAYVLKESSCKLVSLDLRLNEIGAFGGRHISSVLLKSPEFLEELCLAGCGLNRKNYEFGRVLAFNKILKVLDLSNNRLGEDVGKEFLKGIKYNGSLLKFDVRMCNIEPETEFAIREKIYTNRMGFKLKNSEKISLRIQKVLEYKNVGEEIKCERDVKMEMDQLFNNVSLEEI